MKKLLYLFVFLVIISFSYAWTSDTHEWICEKANLYYDCTSADNTEFQKQHPGSGFVNHHCADNESDCSARIQAEKFKGMGDDVDLGIASHLYADSMVPVHWYSLDYDTCHKIFEDEVEKHILNENANYEIKVFSLTYNLSNEWNVNMSCKDKDGAERNLYADANYMQSVINYVAEKMDSRAMADNPERVKVDLTIWVILFLVFVAVIFIMFLISAARR